MGRNVTRSFGDVGMYKHRIYKDTDIKNIDMKVLQMEERWS